MQSQYRALHYTASRGKNRSTTIWIVTGFTVLSANFPYFRWNERESCQTALPDSSEQINALLVLHCTTTAIAAAAAALLSSSSSSTSSPDNRVIYCSWYRYMLVVFRPRSLSPRASVFLTSSQPLIFSQALPSFDSRLPLYSTCWFYL